MAALQFAPLEICTSPCAVIFPSKPPRILADFSKNISPLIRVSVPMTVISGAFVLFVVGVDWLLGMIVFLPIPGIVRLWTRCTPMAWYGGFHTLGCIVCGWLSPIPSAYAAILGIGGIDCFYGAS